MQSPPTTHTQEKKEDEDEGTMPPYDEETQQLIDGKHIKLNESALSESHCATSGKM